MRPKTPTVAPTMQAAPLPCPARLTPWGFGDMSKLLAMRVMD